MTKPRAAPALWSSRGPLIVGYVTLVLLVAGFGGWSILTTIDGALVTQGQIEVDQNRQIVQHPDGGVVAEIAVKEAQAVKVGDLLIRLDGSLLRSELVIVEARLFEVLARRARLEAEHEDKPEPVFSNDLNLLAETRPEVAEQIKGQRSLFIARQESQLRQTEQLGKRGNQITAQIAGIVAQTKAVTTQLYLIQKELADQQTLFVKGLAQSGRVLALEREAASLQGNMGQLIAAKAEAEGRATEIDLEILRVAALHREEASTQLRDLEPQAMELSERRRALIERISRLDIRAPVAGLVLGLAVTAPRSVLRPADPVLYIVPQDRALAISIRLQPIDRDEVHVSQKVRLVFPGFSARSMPEIFGRVTSISADALLDQRTQLAFYRVEIQIDDSELAKLRTQTLMPGMPVDAFIETGAHSPMSYLLKPFTDYFSVAMRES